MPRRDPIGVAVGGDHDIACSDPPVAACVPDPEATVIVCGPTPLGSMSVTRMPVWIDIRRLGSATEAVDEHCG